MKSMISLVAVFLVFVLIASHPHREVSGSFPHIVTIREIRENCQALELVGITRDGHWVTIYDCGDGDNE